MRVEQIVALHGQVGMATDWDSLGDKIQQNGCALGCKLKAVDIWSYLEGGEVSLAEFGNRLNQDQDDGQILLGYSMGGRLALHALINQPQKWKAAVIISAHAGLSAEDRVQRRVIDDEWARKAEDLYWPEFLTEWNSQGVLGADVMPDRAPLESRKREISRSFKCWSIAEQEDLLGELTGLEIPILWVVGEKDEKFMKQGELVSSALGNIRLLVIPDAGHRVPWEAEEDLANGVIEWFSEVL